MAATPVLGAGGEIRASSSLALGIRKFRIQDLRFRIENLKLFGKLLKLN